jgi:hypothetical protein
LARAKRTDRNEARRRYRAEQAARATEPEQDDDAPAPEPRSSTRTARPAGGTQPPRPSIMGAFRGAFRPMDLRGDLQALPSIVTHWAVLVSAAISIGATIVFIAATNDLGASLDLTKPNPTEGISISSATNFSYLVISLFVAPPPAAGAFLIGFTAKRASWLGGLVQGIVATACYAAIILSPAGRVLTGNSPTDTIVVSAVGLSPIGAALFASAAAWYRRFLNMANPNRGAQRPARSSGKSRARASTSRSGARR